MMSQTSNKGKRLNLIVVLLLTLTGIPVIYMFFSEKNSEIKQSTDYVLNNGEVNTYFNEGFEAYQAKDYKKCIELTKKSLEIDSNNARAYNNLGAAYNELHMWDKGIEACEKALEIDPSFELAKNNLNWALSQRQDSK